MINFIDILREFIQVARVLVQEGEPEAEKQLNVYEWLLKEMNSPGSTRVVQTRNRRFTPGKIHIFYYDAKHKDKLDYWDRHPIMLHLGTILVGETRLYFGINISWYPTKTRKFIVGRIQEIYETEIKNAISAGPLNTNRQPKILLDVYRLRTLLELYGLAFAFRFYLPEQIRSNVYQICYEDWDKIIQLDVPRKFPDIRGGRTLSEIYLEFIRHVRAKRVNVNETLIRIQNSRTNRRIRYIDR